MFTMEKRGVRRESKARMDAYELVFTALAHPARRRIMLTLNFEGGSMTAGEIAEVFEHAWPTTTRHIQVLESAGLLYHEQRGRIRVYHINRRRLELVRDWLEWFSKDAH
jgi:DNA-binding transcriptional ArsR family regulator